MKGSRGAITDRWWIVALLAAVVVVLLVNPVGFIGGGLDDYQYLNAARCWREFGPCLPYDHWQARWPVIAPIAGLTAIFGESRTTVGAMPLIESVVCLFLLAAIGNRMFGRPIGWVAAFLMLATPVFAIQLLDPSVESVELGFVLAGFLALLVWEERREWHLAFLSGLSFSLAVQTRETAGTAALFAFVYLVLGNSRLRFREYLWAGAGFALPFAVEFTTFWIETGNPLWRRELDLQHTLIPSSELKVRADQEHGPFFNTNHIANWKRVPGIHIWWAIDGLINLFANPESGLSLIYTPILAAFGRSQGDRVLRRRAMMLWLIAFGYACVLIYAFAIDPKPRMMFVPFALANLAFALLSYRLFPRKPAVLRTIWLVCAAEMLLLVFAYPTVLGMEKAAKIWIAQYRGEIEVDENTRRHLALVPAVERLPGVDADRPYFLYQSAEPCDEWIQHNGLPTSTFTMVAEVPSSRFEVFDARVRRPLCLFRSRHQVSGNAFREAFRRSRDDGSP